jgi:hypothetical protein
MGVVTLGHEVKCSAHPWMHDSKAIASALHLHYYTKGFCAAFQNGIGKGGPVARLGYSRQGRDNERLG